MLIKSQNILKPEYMLFKPIIYSTIIEYQTKSQNQAKIHLEASKQQLKRENMIVKQL